MDIDQWLLNTSAPEGEGLAARLGIPSFLQRANPEPIRPTHKRKRSQPPRESSLLEETVSLQRDASEAHQGALQEALESGSPSRASSRAVSTSVSAVTSTGLYKRKPRKKTRVDRYDPKPRKSKRRRQTKREDREETRNRKKSRRSKEKHGSGVIQAFRAKNVASDRLTLKPPKDVGLFKNGRASSPRRGRGLPDLCFSEMKFLQKTNEPSTEPAKMTTTRTSKKTKQEKTHGEQISAFFGASRNPLAECDPNAAGLGSKGKQLAKPHNSRREENSGQDSKKQSIIFLPSDASGSAQKSSNATYTVFPSMGLPNRPVLGRTNKRIEPSETSHYTWSNSRHISLGVSDTTPRKTPEVTAHGREEISGKEATDSRTSRPLSRGKRLSRSSPHDSSTRHKAISSHCEDQADLKKPFRARFLSPRRVSDLVSTDSNKTKGNANHPSVVQTPTARTVDDTAQDSSSSLSRLLRQCDAVVANTSFVQSSRGSDHDHIPREQRLGKQKEAEEKISNPQNRSRHRLGLSQPSLQDPLPYGNDNVTHEGSRSKAPAIRSISVDRETPFPAHFLSNELDHDFDILRNRVTRQGWEDWDPDEPYSGRTRQGSGFVIVDEANGNEHEASESETMFARFWKPNKLY